jgi:3-oxoacyl-[acyl-carrier-protein] synthase-3
MRMMVKATAFHAPPRVETAEEISALIGKSAEWIRMRTGVDRRHRCEEPLEVLAARPAREVLNGETPDLLIYASASPRQLIPDTSVFVARELGLGNISCHSVHATCLSFPVALHTAGAFISCGAYRKILIISSEISSVSRRLEEPESAALLGDGAAAALVVPTPHDEQSALLAWRFRTFPEASSLAELPGCGTRHHPNAPGTVYEHHQFTMNGPRIYKFAIPRIRELIREVLADANLTMNDIRIVVPHQASGPGLQLGKSYGIPSEKTINVVAEYGNCVAASIPMALAIAHAEGRLERGYPILIIGTGAGMSIGAAVLRW